MSDLKLCVTCRFYDAQGNCVHEKNMHTDPVDGVFKPRHGARWLRVGVIDDESDCGPSGKWHEPKEIKQ